MSKKIFLILIAAIGAFADPPAGRLQVADPAQVPLASGLKFAAFPSTTNDTDIVTGNHITLVNGATLTGQGAGGAGTTALTTSIGQIGTYPIPPAMYGAMSNTWTFLVRANVTSFSDWSGPFVIPNPSCSNTVTLQFMKYGSGTNVAVNECGTLSGAEHFAQFDPFSNSGYWSTSAGYTVYALVINGPTMSIYKQVSGSMTLIESIDRGQANPLIWDSTQKIQLFNGMGGTMDAVLVWNRVLAVSELDQAKTDPYQVVTNYYQLSGSLGATGAGAKVTITGPVSSVITADASGNYLLDHVTAGSYTVAVKKIGVSFSPASSQSTTVSTADVTLNFTSTTIPSGNVRLEIEAQSPTSAGVRIYGHRGNPCTLNLFEGGQIIAATHPDATDSVDTSRPDTQIYPEYRLVRIGHDTGNNAMAGGRAHLLNVVCGSAGQANLVFTQPVIAGVATENPAPGVDTSKPNNYDFPDIPWTTNAKQIVLPFTGLTASPTLGPLDRRWETLTAQEGLSFTDVYGGTGWNNPRNLLGIETPNSTTGYASSNAGNQNPLFLMINNRANWRRSGFILDNIGVQPWGSGDQAAAADRQMDFCIVRNMATQACDPNPDSQFTSPYFSVTLPQGANSAVPNGDANTVLSHVANKPYPVGYPLPKFKGWNTWLKYEEQAIPNISISGISAGVVTLATGIDWDQPFFPEGLKNNLLYLPGISKASCPGDYCLVSDVPNPNKAILADTSISSGAISGAIAYQYAIKAWKHTATGSINFAARYVWSGRFGQILSTNGPGRCSPIKTTNAASEPGSNCFLAWANFDSVAYFMPDSPDGVPQYYSSLSWSPFTDANWPGTALADRPSSSDGLTDQGSGNGGAYWSKTDANTFFVSQVTRSGGIGLFKGELWKNPVSTPASPANGTWYTSQASSNAGSWPDGNILWTALMPGTNDLITQLNAKYPSYSLYASQGYSGKWAMLGMTGTLAVFGSMIAPQDSGPCLIALVDTRTTPSQVVRFFTTGPDQTNIAETNGGFPELGWGACHAFGVDALFPSTVIISVNVPGNGGHHGPNLGGLPMMMAPDQVMMQDGSWSGVSGACPTTYGATVSTSCKTGLPWPPPLAGGTSSTQYKSDYSGSIATLPQVVRNMIYYPPGKNASNWTSNQFVRIRFKGPGTGGAAAGKSWVCTPNDTGTAFLSTCGWSSSYKAAPNSWKPKVGDRFAFGAGANDQSNRAPFCGLGFDNTCEIMMVAQINSITDSYVDMWVLRDASNQYTCIPAAFHADRR
jgi:hypothetical protein